jgi:hypothetical protein
MGSNLLRKSKQLKEFFGFYSKKIGAGGRLQPYSSITGRYVSNAGTFHARSARAVNTTAGHVSTGFTQGFASGYANIQAPPAISKAQHLGQTIGNAFGTFGGMF